MNNAVAKRFFEAIAMKANHSSEGKKIMQKWVGHYDGKVIQFVTDAEKFYLVVTKAQIKVLEGEYPAPDLTFKGTSKLISEVFTGRRRFGDATKNWELVLIGAGHEGFALGRLVTTMMLEV